jgi:CBS domain containing-hemolysin-like protein
LDPASWLYAGLAGIGLLVVGFAAAAEMSLASVSRVFLRRAIAAQESRAQLAETLVKEPARFLATLLALKIIGVILFIGASSVLIQRLTAQPVAFWWYILMAVVVMLAQLLPRVWVVGRQEAAALRLAPLVHFFAILLTPITAIMRRVGHTGLPEGALEENIFLSEDGLRFLLNVTEEETVIEDEEKEMIASIFQFGETLVREVMVPRIDVEAVSAETPMLEALDVILRAGHSRIPVFAATIDNIVGILYAKDLLRYLRDGRTDVPLGRILRPAYFIPESKKVDELLQELQLRKVHMAVVVDEYGGTAGVVTIEDLLEEIVGEIQDEYDAEEPTIEPVGEHEYLFDARVSLGEVNDLLGVQLPAEGGDTLGGFIYSQLGKVPAVGDAIAFDNVRIEVLSVAGRRIKQVRAILTEPEAENAPASGDNSGGPSLLGFFSPQ